MKKLLVVLIVVCVASSALAQQAEVRRKSGPRRQLATIVFAGLGGAILGLSTLSFYGRPQERLVNIAMGFALGVIAGTVYVTFRSATTREYLDGEQKKEGPAALNLPDSRSLSIAELDLASLEGFHPEEPSLSWAPLVEKADDRSFYGGQILFRF